MKTIELMFLQRSTDRDDMKQVPEAACKAMCWKSMCASLRPFSISAGNFIHLFCVWYISTKTSDCIAPLWSTWSINISPKMVRGCIALLLFVQILVSLNQFNKIVLGRNNDIMKTQAQFLHQTSTDAPRLRGRPIYQI